MKMTSFWGHFEEDSLPEKDESCLIGQTQTRQREEPDQDSETDSYRAIPFAIISGTKTLTKQREEVDQDSTQAKYSVFGF